MKGKVLEAFGQRQVKHIEDITEFVKEQGALVASRQLDKLWVPVETVFRPSDEALCKKLGIDG